MNADGVTDRKTQVRNFIAALLSTGIFGGVLHMKPAKSRWMSTTFILAMQLAGILLFNLLPRAWRLAFGEWEIPRGVVGDDFAKMVRSKCWRAKLFLCGEFIDIRAGIYCFLAAPAEHLLLLIEKMDADKDSLRVIARVSDTNPVVQCLVEYAAFLMDPLSTSLQTLVYHLAFKGLGDVAVCMRAVLQAGLSLAAKIW